MEEETREEHIKKAVVPGIVAFIVAGIVSLILYVLEKRGVIEDRKVLAPLASMSSGVCVLVFGVRNKKKGMMMSGTFQLTGATIGLIMKLRKAKASAKEVEAAG